MKMTEVNEHEDKPVELCLRRIDSKMIKNMNRVSGAFEAA